MDALAAVLERARDLGFLGPGGLDDHLTHARGFVRAWHEMREDAPRVMCDLGAGGGVPGLALALEWPNTQVGLLEASARRCRFLREATVELGIEARTQVIEGRAERLARTPTLEGRFDLVTARSFGHPATTAECGARLLAPAGLLVVAEPPEPDPGRWPSDGVAMLGLRLVASTEGPRLAVLLREEACPDRYPRRDGIPAKRPLF